MVALGVALAVSAPPAASQGPTDTLAPYRNPRLPVSERVQDLLGRMTLEEKFWQLYMSPGSLDDPSHDYRHGSFGLQIAGTEGGAGGPGTQGSATPGNSAAAHAERVNAVQRFFVERTRLGIPIIPFDEALHGLVRTGATAFPQAIALAATWDTALVGRVARAIAAETRSRGVRQVLSPVVNLADDARWGRVEETYGEDPLLASLMGAAFVRAFENAGIVATPKHFVANVGEGGRDSYPVHWTRRRLAEMDFPPFVAALDAGARSVMTAYNSVDGLPATQNPWLLGETLKEAWGFGGFVISDAAATGGATVLHMTEESTPLAAAHAWQAGLDVVFQSTWEQHAPYLEALRRGLVADPVVDAAVARVLRAKFELGLFEDPWADPAEAARLNGHPAHRALALEAARASLVLLRNDAGALPLSSAVSSVAVIGVDAVEARLGGYSGPGNAPVSILEGIRARLDAREAAPLVRYAPGPGRGSPGVVTVPAGHLTTVVDGRSTSGLGGAYFDNIALEGEPVFVRTDTAVDFTWTLSAPGRGIPRDWYSVRWTGTVTAPAGGVRRLGVTGNDGYRLWLDGELVVDNWTKRSFGTRLADVAMAPGTTLDVRLEYFETTGNARVRLVWDAGVVDDAGARIGEAVEAARGTDVAVVVVGIEEGEFRDRAFLGLPGRQDSLIRAVAGTGTPTVVVLVAGSPVTMPWLEDVDAVLLAWYPGEEGGTAVADVLFGDADPAGRLPMTFPMAEGQLPLRYNHKPTGRGDDYLDLTGHPLFPFGHGLGYTRFAYSGLAIEPDTLSADGTVPVRVRVRNVGDRAGDEVVQLYVRDELASVARPVIELKGFRRIRLQPGEEREVAFHLTPGDLSLLDVGLRRVVEPGTFRILVGASSRDLRLRGELVVR